MTPRGYRSKEVMNYWEEPKRARASSVSTQESRTTPYLDDTQEELDRLNQGSMSVDEYWDRFCELVGRERRNGTLFTPAFLAAKFRNGLSGKVAEIMEVFDTMDLYTIVDRCRNIEAVRNETQRKEDLSNQSSSSRFENEKNSDGERVDNAARTRCRTCRKTHRGACWYKTKACYNCREIGHIARGCPRQEEHRGETPNP